MNAVLTFALTLFIAVLVSEFAQRTVLSAAVLFLISGFLLGDGMLGVVILHPDHPVVGRFAELALFSTLFTDGMRIGLRELTAAWHLPGRALLLGLPLTLLGTALLAASLVDVSWMEALLIGAALSPTDPVFAAAIVGREEVPERVRSLLNVESGLNDGLALPLVVLMLAALGSATIGLDIVLELAFGVALGVGVPWVAARLERSPLFSVTDAYAPLYGFAVGLLVFSLASLTHANEFLAAFAAGVTLRTVSPTLCDAFHPFGTHIAELLKLAGLLVFGALISPQWLLDIAPRGYVFAVLSLLVVRPGALWVALARSPLTWREWVTVAWFGPKGFASMFFGLLILQAAVPHATHLFHLLAVVIAGSIIAHSSTDVLVARWVQRS